MAPCISGDFRTNTLDAYAGDFHDDLFSTGLKFAGAYH